MADKVLQKCLNKTKTFSSNWKYLGLLLQVKKHLLDATEKNYQRDVDTCKMEMLATWLRSNPADPDAELDAALKELRNTLRDAVQCKICMHIASIHPTFVERKL